MLLPIIMIVVCVLLGGGTLLFLKFSEKRKKAKGRDKEELAQMTANEFVNVKDIRGSFLYPHFFIGYKAEGIAEA